MKNSVSKITFILLVAILLSISTQAVAQDDAPTSGIAESWVMTVDMASQPAFEAAFKAHVAARAEAGDPASWQVYTSNTGNSLNQYFVRNCCFQWADRDAYDAWAEESNIQADWNENVHPHVANYGHHFTLVDFANSNWPQGTEARFVGVTTYDIKPGSGQQFNAAMSELSQIAKNDGWAEAGNAWAWSSAIDGSNVVSLVIPHANYADMAPPDPTFYQFLSESLGSEEAASEIFQRFTGATSGSNYKIYTHRADLSMSDE